LLPPLADASVLVLIERLGLRPSGEKVVFFYQPSWIIAMVCAITFFKAGRAEARDTARDNGLIWAGLSIAISALIIQILGDGWLSVLLAQLGLFVGVGVFQSLREP
jgi:hypothetical protein